MSTPDKTSEPTTTKSVYAPNAVRSFAIAVIALAIWILTITVHPSLQVSAGWYEVLHSAVVISNWAVVLISLALAFLGVYWGTVALQAIRAGRGIGRVLAGLGIAIGTFTFLYVILTIISLL